MSDSVWPHRRQPTRLFRPWDSPGKNTGVGCHFLPQCMKVKGVSEVAQSCLTINNPMNCSPPGSSVHGIFQARVLEWGATAFSETSDYANNKVHFSSSIKNCVTVSSLREFYGNFAMWREYNKVNIVQKKLLTQNRINLLMHAFILLYFLIIDIYVTPSFFLTWQYILITYHVSDSSQVIWTRVAAAWALGAYNLVGGKCH